MSGTIWDAPKISNTGDRYVNGSEGERTTIKCDIEGDDSDITWVKNGLALLPSNNIEFLDDRKTLNILSTRLTDQGEYRCTAANKAGNATQKTNLNVGVPPKILERPRTQVVNRGDQVTLWCEASGVPQPSISWFKDDVLITNSKKLGTQLWQTVLFQLLLMKPRQLKRNQLSSLPSHHLKLEFTPAKLKTGPDLLKKMLIWLLWVSFSTL